MMSNGITSAQWLDSRHTALLVVTTAGRAQVARNSPLGRLAIHSVVVSPCYSILAARYATKDHSEIIARTAEAGDVVISERDTPEFWRHAHECGIEIAPFGHAMPEPKPVRAAPAWEAPLPPEDIPPFLPLPEAQQTGQREFSLQDLLKNADMEGGSIEVPPLPAPAQPVLEPPLPPVPVEDALSEATRRRAAKASVRKAVADVNRVTNEQYLLYHQAMLVRNKNVKAMTEMEIAAAVKGVTVQQLADQIIAEWEARVCRASYVYALEAQALQDIDAARGEDIDAVARKAVTEIVGEDE